MNKFQKLAQLNKDIELLENAGKIKSANILHKKFIREAQTTFNYPNTGVNYNPAGYAAPGTAYYDPEAPVTKFQTYAQGGTVAPNTLPQPAGVAYSDPEARVTNFQTYAQGGTVTPNAATQPVNTANNVGDTANQMQAQNTLPGDAEPRLYQSSIQMIANLLNTKMPENRTKAQQIYENTIGQFTNEKRKQAFARQFQAIVSRNFPAGPIK
jgi:hypothetical protein